MVKYLQRAYLSTYVCQYIQHYNVCEKNAKKSCKLRGDITPENGILRTRNHLHLKMIASNYYCF